MRDFAPPLPRRSARPVRHPIFGARTSSVRGDEVREVSDNHNRIFAWSAPFPDEDSFAGSEVHVNKFGVVNCKGFIPSPELNQACDIVEDAGGASARLGPPCQLAG